MNFQTFVRHLLGRGRRRRFFVEPTVRQAKKLFQRHPILLNGICYGSLCAGAEISQQTIQHYILDNRTNTVSNNLKNKSDSKSVVKYDFAPVKRLALWGTLVIPPIYHKWYQWLEMRFPPCKITGIPSSRLILKKTILDQFVFTPPLLILFFGVMAAAEALNRQPDLWQHVKAEVLSKVPPVFVVDCAFWMPVQAFNFAYVPPTWRVLYIGVASFIWLNLLCFAKGYKSPDDAGGKEE
jgi:Mpv17-like protein